MIFWSPKTQGQVSADACRYALRQSKIKPRPGQKMWIEIFFHAYPYSASGTTSQWKQLPVPSLKRRISRYASHDFLVPQTQGQVSADARRYALRQSMPVPIICHTLKPATNWRSPRNSVGWSIRQHSVSRCECWNPTQDGHLVVHCWAQAISDLKPMLQSSGLLVITFMSEWIRW